MFDEHLEFFLKLYFGLLVFAALVTGAVVGAAIYSVVV